MNYAGIVVSFKKLATEFKVKISMRERNCVKISMRERIQFPDCQCEFLNNLVGGD